MKDDANNVTQIFQQCIQVPVEGYCELMRSFVRKEAELSEFYFRRVNEIAELIR